MGEDNRGGSVPQVQLGEDVAEVGLDGRFADEKGRCDLLVVRAGGDFHELGDVGAPDPRGGPAMADTLSEQQRAFLEANHSAVMATVDNRGRPHAVPVGALWVQGAWWFTSGPATRKSRDLVADPRCVVSVAVS